MKLYRGLFRRSLRDRPKFAEGHVSLTFLSPKGLVLDVWSLGKNVITLQGSANFSHLSVGDDVGNRVIATVSFGDAGHNPTNPTQALPVSVADTGLFGDTVASLPVTSSYPNGSEGGQVMLSATLGSSQGNGTGSQAISEYGLFDVVSRMLTHRSSGLITKTSEFGILLQWTLLY